MWAAVKGDSMLYGSLSSGYIVCTVILGVFKLLCPSHAQTPQCWDLGMRTIILSANMQVAYIYHVPFIAHCMQFRKKDETGI